MPFRTLTGSLWDNRPFSIEGYFVPLGLATVVRFEGIKYLAELYHF